MISITPEKAAGQSEYKEHGQLIDSPHALLEFLKMSPRLAEIEELAGAIEAWGKKKVKLLTVVPGKMYISYSAPEIAKLLDNSDTKRPLPQNLLADGIGHPISSDGEPYYDSIQPFKENLDVKVIGRYIPALVKTADTHIEKWLVESHKEGFDIVRAVNEMYRGIVKATLLGGKTLPEFDEFAQIVEDLGPLFSRYSLSDMLSKAPVVGPSLAMKVAKDKQEYMDYQQKRKNQVAIAEKLFESLGAIPDDKLHEYGYLGSIMRRIRSKKITPSLAASEITSFSIAAHETTASINAWGAVELAKNPEVHEKVRAEVLQAFPEGIVTQTGLKKLKYTERFMYELLRLYPPAEFLMREVTKPAIMNGTKIPKGAMVFAALAKSFRDETIFENAGEVHPDRYVGRPDLVTLVYNAWASGDEHACVGMQLSIMEFKIVIAQMLLKAASITMSGERPVIRHDATLHPAPSVGWSITA